MRQKFLSKASRNRFFFPGGILAEAISMVHLDIMYRLNSSRIYCHESLLIQIFVPQKFIKTQVFPFLLSLLQSAARQINISANIFVSNIIPYEISFFFIKIHAKVFYIQICFKGETPLLFFLIRTMAYRKKTLYRRKKFFFCRLCKNN